MRKGALVGLALLLAACANERPAPKPLTEAGEKVYALQGTVIGRDPGDNTLRVDHQQIPGFMEAMTMDYPVRGAAVTSLPPDKTRVTAKLHVHDDSVWLTDVKRTP